MLANSLYVNAYFFENELQAFLTINVQISAKISIKTKSIW